MAYFGGRVVVNVKQREALVQFMERFPPLALGIMKGRGDYDKSKLMWARIAKILNKIDPRAVKSGGDWAKYWSDLKFKIRRKYANHQQKEKTGQSNLYFGKLDERIKKILSDNDGNILSTPSERISHIQENYVVVDKEDEDPVIKNILKNNEEDNDAPVGHCITIDYDEDGTEMIMPTEYIAFEENHNLIPDRQRKQKLEYKLNKRPEHNYCNSFEYNANKSSEHNSNKSSEYICYNSSDYSNKNIEDIKREILEFQVYKQKQLFQIEKEHKIERHKLEMEILSLRKETLRKQLQRI